MKKNKIMLIMLISTNIIFSSSLVTGNILKKETHSYDFSNSSTNAKWTVMIYFAGDHHRGNDLEHTKNFLKDIGSSKNLNIVGLFDAQEYGDTSYYYIEKDLLRPLPWHPSECNMADPATFESFLRLSIDNYPAENYALFTMSAWGSGWQGVFSDTHGTSSGTTLSLITIPEIGGVLKKITNNGTDKIDVYGIDVCVPGMVEVAYEIAPYVNYMVANEEHGFGGPDEISDDGLPLEWNFSGFLQELYDNSDMNPEEFAKLITQAYTPGAYTPKIKNIFTAPKFYPLYIYKTDLSTTNLTKISLLSSATSNLGNVLINNLDSCRKEIKAARAESREYGKLYRRFWWMPGMIVFGMHCEPWGYDCFIDLYDFAEKLCDETTNSEIKLACKAVMDARNSTILENNHFKDDSSHGLSIYFPQLRCQYDISIWKGLRNPTFRNIPSKYEELRFSKDSQWDEFVREYLKI